METQITITEITHEDLVNLFSTAFYGSNYLGADYIERTEHKEDDCFEDRLARAVLEGKSIGVTDYYAEGDVYGDLPHDAPDLEDAESDGEVMYYVTLEDIKRGLERAADGTFRVNGDEERAFAMKAYASFVNVDEGDFDLDYAEYLMQIILFDEIIYG